MAFKAMQVNIGKIPENLRLRIAVVSVLTVCGLLAGGMSYRIAASDITRLAETRITLDGPLRSYPTHIQDWQGEDVPIPVNVQKVAGADDFISRLYINQNDKTWFNLYVAYTARPRTMLGHRPQICYPASGWINDGTEHTEIVTGTGRKIPCLLHHFHKPRQEREERFILNYYIVNGQLTDNEGIFSNFGWRTPNITGNTARYTAQVQISSIQLSTVKLAATDLSELLIGFFPAEKKSSEKTVGQENLK